MKNEELMVLALAGLAVYMILKAKGINIGGGAVFGMANNGAPVWQPVPVWKPAKDAYDGTWTANGPMNVETYDKQIYD